MQPQLTHTVKPRGMSSVAMHASCMHAVQRMQCHQLTHTVKPRGMSVAIRTSTTYSELMFGGGQTL